MRCWTGRGTRGMSGARGRGKVRGVGLCRCQQERRTLAEEENEDGLEVRQPFPDRFLSLFPGRLLPLLRRPTRRARARRTRHTLISRCRPATRVGLGRSVALRRIRIKAIITSTEGTGNPITRVSMSMPMPMSMVLTTVTLQGRVTGTRSGAR